MDEETKLAKSREIERKLHDLKYKRRLLDEQINRMTMKWRELEASDLPSEDGWYLSTEGNIARRHDGVWDDGWGNSGVEFPMITGPLTRLIPETT